VFSTGSSLAADTAKVDFVIIGQYEFFIRKCLPSGHFIPYLTQFDIKKEIFINLY
jgi:hypothetical protein